MSKTKSVFVVIEDAGTYSNPGLFVLGIYNDRKLAVKNAKKYAEAHCYVLAFAYRAGLLPEDNPGDEWEKEPTCKDDNWSAIRILEIEADCPCVRISLEEGLRIK